MPDDARDQKLLQKSLEGDPSLPLSMTADRFGGQPLGRNSLRGPEYFALASRAKGVSSTCGEAQ
jgi:hypothetical protein